MDKHQRGHPGGAPAPRFRMVIPRRMLPRVADGCGCCTLKTCCYVQGYLALFCFLGILSWTTDRVSSICDLPCKTTEECNTKSEMLGVLSAILVLSALSFMSTIAFLRGIFQKRPNWLVPYIWMLGLNMVLLLIIIIGAIVEGYPASSVFGFVTDVVFVAYLLVHAESLYYDMMDAADADASRLVSQAEEGVGHDDFAGGDLAPHVDFSSPPAYSALAPPRAPPLTSLTETKDASFVHA